MFRLWRRRDGAVADGRASSITLDQLSSHLRRDLNLPDERDVFLPHSIRDGKLPPAPSF
jgi:hypothetical protein